jgi:hypothetical protein
MKKVLIEVWEDETGVIGEFHPEHAKGLESIVSVTNILAEFNIKAIELLTDYLERQGEAGEKLAIEYGIDLKSLKELREIRKKMEKMSEDDLKQTSKDFSGIISGQ